MIRQSLVGATAASVLALSPLAASAQDQTQAAQFVQNTLRAYVVLALRSVVDFTYESFSYDPLTGPVATGLKIYPPLDWLEDDEECEISIGRVAVIGTLGTDSLTQVIEVTNLTVPPICLAAEVRAGLAQVGYEGATVETAVIQIEYNLASSSAHVTVQAALAEAATLNIVADFPYFWFAGIIDDDPYPVIQLSRAEISVTNDGLWERVEPMVSGMIGSVDALPDMATGGLTQELAEGGTRELSADEQAFIASLGDALRSFLVEKRRVTVVVAPEGGVWLNEDTFDGPGEMISTLKPVVSTGPHSNNSVLSPALLAAALAGDQGLSDADRLAAGRALMTGLGAPRNREAAMRLLVPLAAGNWDAEAAMTLAEGLTEMGDAQAAYPYALVALAGGNTAAASLAARLEADLEAASVIETQAVILSSFPADPGLADRRAAISANPDVAAMRTLALDTRLGRGVPRNYATAYLYASLAAAAGDRASANLRDDLDRLAAGDPAWATSLAEASAEALGIWTEEGLGEAIHSALGSR